MPGRFRALTSLGALMPPQLTFCTRQHESNSGPNGAYQSCQVSNVGVAKQAELVFCTGRMDPLCLWSHAASMGH
jgi:hypothetical protein